MMRANAGDDRASALYPLDRSSRDYLRNVSIWTY